MPIIKNYVGMKYQVVLVISISYGQCKYQAVALFADEGDAEKFAEMKNKGDD